mmetsp:Transcript_59977/g.82373  ORF Transcript_59977/g.82373 Transcript_59977/m.82373 type:complete len:241 (+) Transcript_59977:599-1321(+)|eukprot:CAMPEP_0176355150 /NCGR_PEP_ID=MMETSP0126-20121128/13090_1 /TAXON_ID=141414 ORGANISM="Strombidinopsis acuminatum, Strain SPMC142" /NCGR_SAMPLE_ID=MMETSP0126 /ASSEMBLY_ACC=CAM_ASM_000229 /LENGTH=240 /DNA_ID=CAMNT_0017707679 /DNA_START=599 /DNA_END=1321 /DNA_ORIENTATION=-
MSSKFKESAPQDPKYKQLPSLKGIKEFELNYNHDCVVFLEEGGAMFRHCNITMKSMPKLLKSRLAAMIACPRSTLNLTDCRVLGNETCHNAAAILINANATFSYSSFKNFKAGAIYTVARPDNAVLIQDCEISNCSVCGVYCHGEGSKQFLLRLKIENIVGPGIRINRGCCSKIMGCKVSESKCGIEAVSCQPLILMNHFKNNYENGVVTIAKNGLRCDAMIKLNEIERNKENGILCQGD